MARYSISQPVTQVEAPRLLTGQGCYTDDITLPRQAHAVFLRSPHAHADIVSLDKTEAEKMPGVLAILTGEDYDNDRLGNVMGPSPLKRRDGQPMFRPPRPALTRDRVRHIGQSVAMVIAETINQAKDAAEAINVDFAPLPAQLSTEAANQPGTPALWEDCPDNEFCFAEAGDSAAVEELLAKAPHVVNEKFIVNRVTANAMEPRAVAAEYDKGRDHYAIHACMQRPYVWRTMMTKHLFHIPENQMSLTAGDVGGSFGMKGGLYPEVPLVAWAAKRVGRPVKWNCERSEGHMADDQARDIVFETRLGLDDDGKFQALDMAAQNNAGAYLTMLASVPPPGLANSVVGVYATPAVHGQCQAVMTNTVPVSNYRSPGKTPSSYAMERIIDIAAQKIGMDPAEIRRRNLIPADAMPYSLPVGGAYDCGEFEKVLDKCLTMADYDNRETRRKEAKARGKLLGIGLSTTVDPSAGPSPETAEMRFDPGGNLTVLVGSTAGGQSHATIYTQIVSDKLGVEAEDVRVIEGDTEKLSWGTGTGAARTATIGGTAVFKATEKVIEKGRRITAHLLEAAPADIEFEDATYTVSGTDKSIPFGEVAQSAFVPSKIPPGEEMGLFETATWTSEVFNIPNSAHVCEVEIDPETGTVEIVNYTAVHDVGVELNPPLVNSQVYGGIAQGAGQALMENINYDDSGQLLSGSFMDYAMPRADNFIQFQVGNHPVPTTTNPLGVKGAGECGTVGGLAAVMNAVNDALAPLGIRDLPMPATSEKVWRAIRGAG